MTDSDHSSLAVLASKVEAITEGVSILRKSGISNRALTVLIQYSAPTVKDGSGTSRRLRLVEINAVLQGLDGLEDFIFKKEEDDEG